MRRREKHGGISVQAIAGPFVVLLGFDVTAAKRKGLLGFAIHRVDHTENEAFWLRGFRTFEATAPNPPPGTLVSTMEHPIQAFNWGDYTAKPDHRYTYTVRPLYGSPANLKMGPETAVTVATPNPEQGDHAVFFNRGVAGSQAYARKFGNLSPKDLEDDPVKQKAAYRWLSRGLEEAILAFIGQAKGSRFALRASVYEFSWLPVLEAFGKASDAGADVKIVYDRRKRGPFEATEAAADEAGIRDLMIPRRTNSAISHNKFIVLLRDSEPIEVWTGSTNFTEGGIFGQSNVGFVLRDPAVARRYHDYWTRLSADPEFKVIRPANVEATPDPEGLPPPGATPLFSPRTSLTALEWYGERMGAARQLVGFTAAFGISSTLAPYLLQQRPYLRFILVESEGNRRVPKAQPGQPPPKSQYEIFQEIEAVRNNRVAKGAILAGKKAPDDQAVGGALHRWLEEKLTDLNFHVRYLHTKYMLLDALTDDPIVISGSANFSAASTTNNDENMVIVRGDTDLADMYLGEFMRLFDHFYFRDVASRYAAQQMGETPKWSPYLAPDDSWTDPWFEAGSEKFLERKLLA